MPQASRFWTRDEVLALPDDGNRYELIDGELLVSPSPTWRHQTAIIALVARLRPYVREHRLGHLLSSPADLDLKSGQLSQPDIFVGARGTAKPSASWTEFGVPTLIAEVLSPATAQYDRMTKRRRYQRSGVGTYWIVDLDARLVEVWHPEDERPVLADEAITWQSDPSIPPLVIDLREYFREVLDES